MKYALQATLRFNTIAERDKLYDALQAVATKQFSKDDAYITKHICYHDEGKNKPCDIEVTWKPK